MFNIANQYYSNPFIVAFARGDVTGDKIPDNVYLIGQKTADSPFIQNITLVVQDGRTLSFKSVPLSDNAGYSPTLFLGDFTGNGAGDILIEIVSGGSGAFTFDYIYSFLNNVPKLIFDFNKYNAEYTYSVNYKDFYKVEVISLANKTKYLIDISDKGADYLNEIYNKNGKLKAPIVGFANPLSSLIPADIDSDGIYELIAFQKIAGRYNADSLGYIQNFLKWDKNKFSLFNQYLGINGVELS